MNDTILVVVEPDLMPREVVARASWLAAHSGCSLTLLLADADVTALANRIFVSNEAKAIAANMREAQREILEDLAGPAREHNIEVALEVLDQRPVAEAVVQRALEKNPRYVVKGTQYHTQAQRAIFVDTDWQLIRTCPIPLWLVKPREIAKKPTIVAAVDPTHSEGEAGHLDEMIVEQARALAEAAGGQLHLLHSWNPLRGVGTAATFTFKPIRLSVDELNERMEKEHRESLDAFAAAQGIDKRRVHPLPGPARDVIPWFARDRAADVFVMGALARWSGRAVIGSTAEKVLDHLPCDILLIRAG